MAGSQQGSVLLCRCSPSGLEPMGLGAGSCRRVALGVALLLVDTRSPECAQRRALACAMASPAGQAHGRAPHCTRSVSPLLPGRDDAATLLGAPQTQCCLRLHVRCVRHLPCVHAHVYVCTHMRVLTHVCTRLCSYTCLCLCAFARAHTCAYVLVYAAHTRVLTHVCVCV